MEHDIMAKRTKEALKEEEKRKLNGANLSKLLGIFQYVIPYRVNFIIGLIALVLSSSTLLSFPYFSGELLDVASGKTDGYFSSINQIGIVLIVILFVQSIFSFIRVYTFAIVSERTLADLRKSIYQKIIRQPMSFFDARRAGELQSRITLDVATLQDTFSFTLAELIRQFLTLVIGVVVILYLTPKLTLFMLLTFPVLIVLALVFGKFIRKLSGKTQDLLAEANVIVEESLQSISVVKAFTNEAFEISRYGKALLKAVNVSISAARFRGLFIAFIIFAIVGGMVGVGWYGALLIQQGKMSHGELFSFILYTAFIGGSIAGLGDLFTQLQRSIGASERILEMLHHADEEQQRDGERFPMKGDVRFDGVSFSYPTRPDLPVLREVSFHVRPGEKVALVGKSGSGKSTIINLLMRFYPLADGTIAIDGKNAEDYDLAYYRQHIGIVPQEVILFGGSIRENIAYAKPDASDDEIYAAAEQANALEFIERFPEKFETKVGDRGVKLSGGQRQRIAIARAILKNPLILVLDEATSSLDAHSEMLVQEALEKLMKARTTIIIAHRLSTIKKVDAIFVLQDGNIIEHGSHDDLVLQPEGIYNNLLKLQLR